MPGDDRVGRSAEAERDDLAELRDVHDRLGQHAFGAYAFEDEVRRTRSASITSPISLSP